MQFIPCDNSYFLHTNASEIQQKFVGTEANRREKRETKLAIRSGLLALASGENPKFSQF